MASSAGDPRRHSVHGDADGLGKNRDAGEPDGSVQLLYRLGRRRAVGADRQRHKRFAHLCGHDSPTDYDSRRARRVLEFGGDQRRQDTGDVRGRDQLAFTGVAGTYVPGLYGAGDAARNPRRAEHRGFQLRLLPVPQRHVSFARAVALASECGPCLVFYELLQVVLWTAWDRLFIASVCAGRLRADILSALRTKRLPGVNRAYDQ